MPKILTKNEISNFNQVSPYDKIVFANIGMEVRWVEKSAIIVDAKTKQQRLAFDETVMGYTKNQLPQFKYLVNDKEIIIIRGENRSCVYAPKLPKKDEGIIYHPHGF